MKKFDKICPACASANAASAVQCTCGYLFNPLYREDPRLALELAVREEKLIEEYLTARLEQAVEAARAAAHCADTDQDDARKAVEAAVAQLDAEVAQAELSAQRVRVAEAESRLDMHIAETMPVSGSADTAATKADRSWQTMVVAEALKAKSTQGTARRLGSDPVAQRKEPGATFRAAQAAKAERAVAAANLKTMTCPSCGAPIAVKQIVCRCGWSVSKTPPERERSQTRGTGERGTLTEHLETKRPTKRR